jgi:hypothetical protein
MFDILATMGVAAIGEIIKQSVSGAVSWAKGRKKPAPEVVSQKVEELVTKATEKVVPDSLAPEDRQRIVTGLIDVVRPTLDQVMQYSPNTAQIVYAVRHGGPVKKAAPKKAAAKKAVRKAAAHRAVKRAAHKRR